MTKHKEAIKKEFTWANLISLGRFLILIPAFLYLKEYPYILAISIVIIILLDALDGIVARRSKKKGSYGALIDIFADRAVELTILYVYAFWGLIPWLIPIIFTVRGITTDFIRVLNYKYPDDKFKEPLSVGKAHNRFIRGFYGFVKLVAFSIILIMPKLGFVLIFFTLIMNLYRGIPVILSSRTRYLFGKFFGRK